MSSLPEKEIVCLSRDTWGMMIPSGARMMLHQGTTVTITQSKGNTFTVNAYGNLLRIEAVDADSLGKTFVNSLDELPDETPLSEKIIRQLKTVYDPEIPVNIFDLGLIYHYDTKTLDPASGDSQVGHSQYHIDVTMTLTAPGCGMGPSIAADVQSKLLMIPEVLTVDVQLVFEPPWDRSMMSEAAQLELGL